MANLDLGAANVLGDPDTAGPDGTPLGADDMRERLALSTRYLANWYAATKGSTNQDIWYQKIDALRNKVESTYKEMLQDENLYFPTKVAKGDYLAAAGQWSDLYQQLQLSADTLPQASLIDKAGDLVTTVLKAPTVAIPNVFESIGKTINSSVGNFMAQIWPVLTIVIIGGVVYIFRKPLVSLAGKVGT